MTNTHHINTKYQKGQIALIVLLVATVMLTIGLAVVQRSLFDVKLTEQEEESSRAFQAAETGVEEALRKLTPTSGSLAGDTNYNVTVADSGQDGFVTEEGIGVGEVLMVDLTGNTAPQVDIFYFNADDCSKSKDWGLEVEQVRDTGGGTIVVNRDLFLADASSGDYSFKDVKFCKRINNYTIRPGALELRIRPIGVPDATDFPTSTRIGVRPQSGVFAPQIKVIRSEGKTPTGVTRVVEVERSVPQLATIFDYALFVGSGDLIKERATLEGDPFDPGPFPEDFELVWSTPSSSDSEWPAAPVNAVVEFNMDLGSSSTLKVVDAGGNNKSQSTTTFDTSRIMRREVQNLASGAYTIEAEACLATGGCKTERVSFTVNTTLQNTGYTNKTDGGGNDTILVRIRDTGLEFPKLLIDLDDKVQWRNKLSSGRRRVITDYHDTTKLHLYYPALKTGVLSIDEDGTFKFVDRGVYYYHLDNNSDSYVTGYDGIVIVK